MACPAGIDANATPGNCELLLQSELSEWIVLYSWFFVPIAPYSQSQVVLAIWPGLGQVLCSSCQREWESESPFKLSSGW